MFKKLMYSIQCMLYGYRIAIKCIHAPHFYICREIYPLLSRSEKHKYLFKVFNNYLYYAFWASGNQTTINYMLHVLLSEAKVRKELILDILIDIHLTHNGNIHFGSVLDKCFKHVNELSEKQYNIICNKQHFQTNTSSETKEKMLAFKDN